MIVEVISDVMCVECVSMYVVGVCGIFIELIRFCVMEVRA